MGVLFYRVRAGGPVDLCHREGRAPRVNFDFEAAAQTQPRLAVAASIRVAMEIQWSKVCRQRCVNTLNV